MRISPSTLNNLAKCEMAYYLAKTPEGIKIKAEMGKKYALINGDIMHSTLQKYDYDRFVKNEDIELDIETLLDRYLQEYIKFYSNFESLEKRGMTLEDQDLMLNKVIPLLREVFYTPDVKKQAILIGQIRTYQAQLPFEFKRGYDLWKYFEEFFNIFMTYCTENVLDELFGKPIEFVNEKNYNLQFGNDTIVGKVDQRRVYLRDNKKIVILIEFKTSATSYTPQDCQIDRQMGNYCVYEHLEKDTPLEDVYAGMYYLQGNVCTLTQRTESNLNFLLREIQERLNRDKSYQTNEAAPLGICGTNSFEHSRLMCDLKEICPVWQQCKSQPTPIVLSNDNTKKGKKK
jgi:hypothetical protein